MARERIPMNKLREILRLKYEKGFSNRRVENVVGVNRHSVGQYWKLAQDKGINWPDDQKLGDVELCAKLGISNTFGKKKEGKRLHEPDWVYIHRELKKKDVTLTLLWQEYKEENPQGYEYSWFNELYCNWKEKLQLSMRQEHKAGEKLFVDYFQGPEIIDRATGEVVSTDIYLSVWGCSNYSYAEATYSQEIRNWTMSHVRSYEYYGCVPQIEVPDNLKSGVTKACKYEPKINRTYLELSHHYGFVVIPARPRRPKDKAKVEAGVLVARRWILASLRNRKFYSLAELNEAIKQLLEKLNSRKMQKIKKSRREIFEELDRPAAMGLAQKRYEYAEWKVNKKAGIDYHVEADESYYSVPYQMRNEYFDIRLTDKAVEIFHKNKRIASHIRSIKKHKHETLPEHMPKSHRKYLEWTPPRMINWAGKIGVSTKAVIENVLGSKKHPEQAYRSCLGILRLSNHYSKERLENACKRAVKYQTNSYQSIKAILKNNLDKQQDLFERLDEKKSVTPQHENIRGQNYYGDNKSETNTALMLMEPKENGLLH